MNGLACATVAALRPKPASKQATATRGRRCDARAVALAAGCGGWAEKNTARRGERRIPMTVTNSRGCHVLRSVYLCDRGPPCAIPWWDDSAGVWASAACPQEGPLGSKTLHPGVSSWLCREIAERTEQRAVARERSVAAVVEDIGHDEGRVGSERHPDLTILGTRIEIVAAEGGIGLGVLVVIVSVGSLCSQRGQRVTLENILNRLRYSLQLRDRVPRCGSIVERSAVPLPWHAPCSLSGHETHTPPIHGAARGPRPRSVQSTR